MWFCSQHVEIEPCFDAGEVFAGDFAPDVEGSLADFTGVVSIGDEPLFAGEKDSSFIVEGLGDHNECVLFKDFVTSDDRVKSADSFGVRKNGLGRYAELDQSLAHIDGFLVSRPYSVSTDQQSLHFFGVVQSRSSFHAISKVEVDATVAHCFGCAQHNTNLCVGQLGCFVGHIRSREVSNQVVAQQNDTKKQQYAI